jgi:hypothetical protein
LVGLLPHGCNIALELLLIKGGTKSLKSRHVLDFSGKYVMIKYGTPRLNITDPMGAYAKEEK